MRSARAREAVAPAEGCHLIVQVARQPFVARLEQAVRERMDAGGEVQHQLCMISRRASSFGSAVTAMLSAPSQCFALSITWRRK